MTENSDFEIVLRDYLGEGGDVEIPPCVTRIGQNAFCDVNITSVHIPGNVREIGDGAFAECWKLKRVVIDEGTEKMGERAFSGCIALASVTLPDSLEECDWDTFAGCEHIREMFVPAGSAVRNIPDVLGIPAFDLSGSPLPPVPVKEKDWLYEQRGNEICITGRTSKTAGTLYAHLDEDRSTTLYIPATLAGLPVTAIGEKAFLDDDSDDDDDADDDGMDEDDSVDADDDDDDDDDDTEDDDGDDDAPAGSPPPHAGKVLAFPGAQGQQQQPAHDFATFYRQAKPVFDQHAVGEDVARAIWEQLTDPDYPQIIEAIKLLRSNAPDELGLAACKEAIDALNAIIAGDGE